MLTFEIRRGPCNKRTHQVANGVDGIDNASSGRSFVHRKPKVHTVLFVGIDTTHNRAIVTVNAGIESGQEQDAVKLPNRNPISSTTLEVRNLLFVSRYTYVRSAGLTCHEHVLGPWAGLLLLRSLCQSSIACPSTALFTTTTSFRGRLLGEGIPLHLDAVISYHTNLLTASSPDKAKVSVVSSWGRDGKKVSSCWFFS